MTAASRTGDRFDIVVIGGGASGVLVTAHLLAHPAPTVDVALIESRERLAQGVAYSTGRPEHVLNVVAARMSAFDAQPDDFVRFLRARPDLVPGTRTTEALAGVFAPRLAYARYLQQVLESQSRYPALARLTDTAVDVAPVQGGYRVLLRSGRKLSATAVVLALGNQPAPLPVDPVSARAMVVEAWDYPAVAAITPDSDVCIVGSGLSMVDVALTLERNGHRGRMDVLSRHGLMPLPHATSAPAHDGSISTDSLLTLGVRERLRRIRAGATAAVDAGRPWQWTMDGLRRHSQVLWTSLPAAEQRRFLRHAVRYWDIHRHRIAPEVAVVLDRLRAAGRLRLHAGRLLSVQDGDRVQLSYRPRGAGESRWMVTDRIVNATGIEKCIAHASGPLIPALRERGLLLPGPHGIGIATAGEGAVLGVDGVPVAGLWTLGSTRIGDLWESIAIPELRGQAERVAAAALRFATGGRYSIPAMDRGTASITA